MTTRDTTPATLETDLVTRFEYVLEHGTPQEIKDVWDFAWDKTPRVDMRADFNYMGREYLEILVHNNPDRVRAIIGQMSGQPYHWDNWIKTGDITFDNGKKQDIKTEEGK